MRRLSKFYLAMVALFSGCYLADCALYAWAFIVSDGTFHLLDLSVREAFVFFTSVYLTSCAETTVEVVAVGAFLSWFRARRNSRPPQFGRALRILAVAVVLLFSVAAFVVPSAVDAQPSPLQTIYTECDPAVSTCTNSLSLTTTSVSVGQSVVALGFAWSSGNTGFAVTDSGGNSYDLAVSSSTALHNLRSFISFANVTTGGDLTVKGNFSAPGDSGWAGSTEYLVVYVFPGRAMVGQVSSCNSGIGYPPCGSLLSTVMDSYPSASFGSGAVLVAISGTDSGGTCGPGTYSPTLSGWTFTPYYFRGCAESGAMESGSQSSPSSFSFTDSAGVADWSAAGAVFTFSGMTTTSTTTTSTTTTTTSASTSTGANGEGDWTSYHVVLNSTVPKDGVFTPGISYCTRIGIAEDPTIRLASLSAQGVLTVYASGEGDTFDSIGPDGVVISCVLNPSPLPESGLSQDRVATSAYGTYTATLWGRSVPPLNLSIFKDGTVLQTIYFGYYSNFSAIWGITMSPDGQYIAVYGLSKAEWDGYPAMQEVLYQASGTPAPPTPTVAYAVPSCSVAESEGYVCEASVVTATVTSTASTPAAPITAVISNPVFYPWAAAALVVVVVSGYALIARRHPTSPTRAAVGRGQRGSGGRGWPWPFGRRDRRDWD